MRLFPSALLALALGGGVMPRAALGQDTTAAAESPARIPAGTWARIQVTDGGLAWQVGELGHQLPGYCVFVVVPVPGSQTGEAMAVSASHITRLELARGGARSNDTAAPDAHDDARWVPYPMDALRQHEIAAGCDKPGAGTRDPAGG